MLFGIHARRFLCLLLAGCLLLCGCTYVVESPAALASSGELETETLPTESETLLNRLIITLNMDRDASKGDILVTSNSSVDELARMAADMALGAPGQYPIHDSYAPLLSRLISGQVDDTASQQSDDAAAQSSRAAAASASGAAESPYIRVYLYDGEMSSSMVNNCALNDLNRLKRELADAGGLMDIAHLSVVHIQSDAGSVWVMLAKLSEVE